MGLSFYELNLMSMSDYLDFTELWLAGSGNEDEDEDAVRPAEQADIERFFG